LMQGRGSMAPPKYILALDQGTTSSRAMIFDELARERSIARQPTTQLYPQTGWVNQDAGEIWLTTLETARAALQQAEVSGRDVAGIGIVNQRETLVVWDRETSIAVSPAVVWQSRQSQPQVEALLARGMGPLYQSTTGLVPDAYFTASKLAWLLEEDAALRRRAEAGDLLAGTVDSWLLWNLTGGAVHATDVSNASRTMLFDIQTLEWSTDLIQDLAIPPQMLPHVVASAGVSGVTVPELFGEEIPISGIAGDQQAALFGQTCFAPGEAKNTYGTGSFLLMNTGLDLKRSTHRLLSTIAWTIDERVDYALEGSVFISGAAVEWLRDGLGIIDDVQDVEALASSVADAGGVTVVPALTGLGAPHWDAAARGTIVGLTRGSTAAHIARATLEAIAFQTRDVSDAMSADSGIPLTSLRVDGGASRNDLLMQIQADVLGVPVIRPRYVESTAIGAAFLAGLGSGLWPDQATLTDRWAVDRIFEPGIGDVEREGRYAVWRRAVDRSRSWAV
jgi:glycerol kinase